MPRCVTSCGTRTACPGQPDSTLTAAGLRPYRSKALRHKLVPDAVFTAFRPTEGKMPCRHSVQKSTPSRRIQVRRTSARSYRGSYGTESTYTFVPALRSKLPLELIRLHSANFAGPPKNQPAWTRHTDLDVFDANPGEEGGGPPDARLPANRSDQPLRI